jgi:hypothetical protein
VPCQSGRRQRLDRAHQHVGRLIWLGKPHSEQGQAEETGGPSIRATGNSSGRPHRWMVTESGQLDSQNPAYRLTHCHQQSLVFVAR